MVICWIELGLRLDKVTSFTYKFEQIVRALEGNSSLEDLNDNKPSKVPSFAASNATPTQSYDTGMYNADMMKFRKMIMPTQEFSSE